MDPTSLIPTPDSVIVNPLWFHLLLIITFFLHILLMNVMLGLGLLALGKHIRNQCDVSPVCRDISKRLPLTIAFTVNFGVAPLLFLQNIYGHFMYASSVLMAYLWLSVVGLLIFAYYAAYMYNFRYKRLGGGRLIILSLSTLCLLLVAFIMCNNFTLMQRPDTWFRYFANPTGFMLNLADPTLIPRYLHFVASAVAVGALSVAVFYEIKRRLGYSTVTPWITYGCQRYSYATLVNFGIGFWFLGSLPPEVHDVATLRGKLFMVCLFTALAIGLLSVIQGLQGRVLSTLYSALATIFLMILVRDLARSAYLAPYFKLADLKVESQYSPMIFFLLALLIGAFIVIWILKIDYRAVKSRELRS